MTDKTPTRANAAIAADIKIPDLKATDLPAIPKGLDLKGLDLGEALTRIGGQFADTGITRSGGPDPKAGFAVEPLVVPDAVGLRMVTRY